MADNELSEGKTRMGWLIDGDPNTPEVAVMLQNTGKQIVLTVPTKGIMSPRDPYARWFSSGIQFGDDPQKKHYDYAPPRVILFEDKDGSVVLVGCRDAGSSSTFGAGTGSVVPNFAVLGGQNLRYNKINGVRSEFPAFAQWVGLRSVHTNPEKDSQGRIQKVHVTLASPPEIALNRRMNLNLRPAWRTSFPDKVGTFAAHDIVQLETSSKRPTDWEDHLEEHLAIRNLLVLSAWQSFGFSRLEVNRTDDPTRLLNGESVQPRWASVVTHRLPEHEEWKRRPRFLFNFSDIGTKGIRRWIKLRAHFARAMEPIIALADQKQGFWETRMVQSGIALEALGYQLEVDNGGAAFNNRGQLSYTDALDVILKDMKYVPMDDPEEWKKRSRDCYMGVKHADNLAPDSLVLANTYRENLLMMRYWLAGRLGCKKAVLKSRRDADPLANEYVAVG